GEFTPVFRKPGRGIFGREQAADGAGRVFERGFDRMPTVEDHPLLQALRTEGREVAAVLAGAAALTAWRAPGPLPPVRGAPVTIGAQAPPPPRGAVAPAGSFPGGAPLAIQSGLPEEPRAHNQPLPAV